MESSVAFRATAVQQFRALSQHILNFEVVTLLSVCQELLLRFADMLWHQLTQVFGFEFLNFVDVPL